MIQVGSFLKISDNSGGKKALCIKILQNKKKFCNIGKEILVSIKSVRSQETSKIKKGGIYKAIIIRTNSKKEFNCFSYINFFENSIIVLNKQNNKPIGTRIFGPLIKNFKYSKYLKLISLSSGIIY